MNSQTPTCKRPQRPQRQRQKGWAARLTALLAAFFVVFSVAQPAVLAPAPIYAANTVTVDVIGTANQTEARKLLALVNAARAQVGVPALTWDAALEETAIQRAVEQGIFYGHTRPDDSGCFTAWPSGHYFFAENVAWGQRNAQEVNTSWTNSSGHYQNMVNSAATTMAAACFYTPTGWHWVECFGTGAGTGMTGEPLDSTILGEVETDASAVALAFLSSEMQMEAGESDVSLCIVTRESGQSNFAYTNPESLEWTVSNPSVASVSEGTIHALAAGTTTVTARVPGTSAADTMTLTVTGGGVPEPTPTPDPTPVRTGWQQEAGAWYLYDQSGNKLKGWQRSGDAWYYLDPTSGAMSVGWRQIGGAWYYFNASGAMVTGWQAIGGTWYYFASSGAMVTGWQAIGGTWYYFNASGAMVTGWQAIGGAWYYFNSSGAMLSNAWMGNYYLGASGAMLTNTWTPDGYYVGANGAWQSSASQGSSSSSSALTGQYYWVASGDVYHTNPNCRTLARSSNILSGITPPAGRRLCSVCR